VEVAEDDVIGSFDDSGILEDILNVVIELDVFDVITDVDAGPEVKVDVGSIVVKITDDEASDVVDVDIAERVLRGFVVTVVKRGMLVLVDFWMVITGVARVTEKPIEWLVETDVSEVT
jgi:hypothetical protein